MKPKTKLSILALMLAAAALGHLAGQQTNFGFTVFNSAITAVAYNATGAIPFMVNGAQIGCAVLVDCSTLETITGAISPSNKNFLTANNNNQVQLLAQQGTLGAITGTGVSAIQAVYLVVIPQNTPGPGKCIDAKVAFIHTGANSITYNWSFVAHNVALAASGITFASVLTTAGSSEVVICNATGVQNSQTLNQLPYAFGNATAAGGVPAALSVDIGATGGADLAFTFNAGVNADTVTPKAFTVTELL